MQALSDNILRNLRPIDDRSIPQLIDDDFISIDDRTLQEREDDDNISLADNEDLIDTTNAWDENKTEVTEPRPIYKISTDFNRKLKAANKIKNKYVKKKIGQRNIKNKVSDNWLKAAGYLNTKDQDAINYIFVPPKKVAANNIPGDTGHFIRTAIENIDFKKENLASKTKTKRVRKPYKKPAEKINGGETIKILDDIAVLEPGKNAQIAAKKISQKYKKIREAKSFEIPVEVDDMIEAEDRDEIEVVLPPSKISSQKAAKKINEKYEKIRRNKSQKIVESNKKYIYIKRN